MKKLLWLLFFTSSNVFATNVDSDGPKDIVNLFFYSKEDTTYSGWQGVVQLEMASLTWSASTTCSTRYVLIRSTDEHMLSVALTARTANKPLRIYVDDTKRIDNFCFARALGY
ncbi:hypothetical protein [Aliikangiella coralliicola]|uniref:Uncharacterized protein n=1 Tax=Aliikangiella coralliicola TaxID=2592383 RepID=A0A545UAS8_9GAMM|nr:hypothetical protein [Aliikangiella coralliicola]TQV86558.1 hypothetical protein FLL46_16770 [Aliikangiella coralliicola]